MAPEVSAVTVGGPSDVFRSVVNENGAWLDGGAIGLGALGCGPLSGDGFRRPKEGHQPSMPTFSYITRRLIAPALLFGAMATPIGCEPSYIDTIAPDDASFSVSCAGSCGLEGKEDGVIIDVTFVGHGRQFAICCGDVPELRAYLQTIEDFWCDGLDVPDKKIGDLTVGTTTSLVSKERGATLDHGEGYVTFMCGSWLKALQTKLAQTECCQR